MPELRGTIGQDIWQGDSVLSNYPGTPGRGSTGRASEVVVEVGTGCVPTPSSARYAIGIDVGGTKIAGAIVDIDSGGVVAHAFIATGAHRGEVATELAIVQAGIGSLAGVVGAAVADGRAKR